MQTIDYSYPVVILRVSVERRKHVATYCDIRDVVREAVDSPASVEGEQKELVEYVTIADSA